MYDAADGLQAVKANAAINNANNSFLIVEIFCLVNNMAQTYEKKAETSKQSGEIFILQTLSEQQILHE